MRKRFVPPPRTSPHSLPFVPSTKGRLFPGKMRKCGEQEFCKLRELGFPVVDRVMEKSKGCFDFCGRIRFRSFELARRRDAKFRSPVGIRYAHSVLAGYLAGRLNPHGPLRQGKPKFDWNGEASPRQFRIVSAQSQTDRQVRPCGRKIVRFAGSPSRRSTLRKPSPAPAASMSGRVSAASH